MSEWKGMDTAPLDGTTVLLYHEHHGAIQGYFVPLERYDTMDGTEWSGDCWVLGDGLLEEPVERCFVGPDDESGIDHLMIRAWMPAPEDLE